MKFGFAVDLYTGNRVGINQRIYIGYVAGFCCGLPLKPSCVSICRNKCRFSMMHPTAPTYVEIHTLPAGVSDCTIAFKNCKSFLSERNCRRMASTDPTQRQQTTRSNQIKGANQLVNFGGLTGFPAKALGPGSDRENYISL